jgi:lysophospholipase L1-like esterase
MTSLQPRPTLATIAVMGAGFLAGCGGSGTATSAQPSTHTNRQAATGAVTASQGYPDSIAVLGHSGATGENSDPSQPGIEVRTNSWATGTNPKVDSVYLRILAHNPAIKRHNDNYAEAGADVQALAAQADQLLQHRATPELILIQTIDSDVTCPLDRGALSRYRRSLSAILKKLARGAPNSHEFVVSQYGNPRTDASILTPQERASQGGTGPCDFMTPTGTIAAKKLARLESAIHAYESAVKRTCLPIRQCTYSGDALSQTINKRAYYSNDLNHFSIKGHARAAAAAWAALLRTNVIPKS